MKKHLIDCYQIIIVCLIFMAIVTSSCGKYQGGKISIESVAYAQEVIPAAKKTIETTQIEEYKKYDTKIKSLSLSKDLEALNSLSRTMPLEWKSNKNNDYYYLITGICSAFATYDFNNNRRYLYANKCAERVLVNADEMPVELEYQMVSILQETKEYDTGIVSREAWIQDRAKRIKLLLHLWQRVQNNIDHNFDVRNPNNRSKRPALLTEQPPEDRNSLLYTEYETSKNEYIASIQKFNEQSTLYRLNERLKDFVKVFLIGMYDKSSENTVELAKVIVEFNLGSQTSEEILSSIQNNLKGKKQQ